ncbi:MAG: Ni/Fe-hydrogenase, b-type cytochrome subunit [Sulfurovum sp.]|nr:Ni/Fe-hydrogenase, b-type cytochrome subunit [Sulfurovum sp.]
MKTNNKNAPDHVAGEQDIEQEMEFSANYRWQHWVRAVSIVVLTVTGFYIAEPFVAPISDGTPTNFMQAIFRSVHIVFGFLLTAVIIGKSYLFVFGRKHKMERDALKDIINPKIWIQQIGYYLLICKHPKLSGVYNPLQFMAYVGFYIMIFVLIITGFILYANVYHEGFGGLIYEPMRYLEEMMGGLAIVRQVHHITTWGVILFVFGHVYMAVYNAVFGKEGAMDAIFSGMKWHKKH